MLSLAPRRLWPRLESQFPLASAAFASGVLTIVAAFVLGFRGFLAYASAQASARNNQIIDAVSHGLTDTAERLSNATPALSALTIFEFLFVTPTGLFAIYLVASGTGRMLAAWVDDPQGDPVLTAVDWVATSARTKNRRTRERAAREQREGPEVPDLLETGDWAGLPGVDYVVLSSRQKPEWDAGAIVMTVDDWYRLGVPFDMQTPGGLRRAYPLTRMETAEVVRRGIQYELPRLSPRARAALK